MPHMPLFKGPHEVLWGQFFRSLVALSKAAAASLNKDKAVRAHKESGPKKQPKHKVFGRDIPGTS